MSLFFNTGLDWLGECIDSDPFSQHQPTIRTHPQGANTGSGSAKTKAGRGAGGAPWLPVIVEVDGPPHFFNNMPRRSRGDHRLKNRILRAQTGLSNGGVVSVTWWEWVSRTRTQRAKMLVRKMVEVRACVPACLRAWRGCGDAAAY